ncbi:hypothetical protein Tco_0928433, partial [Tanacetum coccineum]
YSETDQQQWKDFNSGKTFKQWKHQQWKDWLFDIDLLTNSMNYEPVTTRNQTNKNAGIKDNVDVVPTQQYIMQPLLCDSPQSSKDAVAGDAGKKTNEEPANEGYANSINKDSTVSPSVSTDGQSFTNTNDLPTDPLMFDLEDTADLLNTGIFSGAYDDKDVGAEANINNLETTMNVRPIPTTRIHKDHPKDQIIGDINLATETRRMTKISEEVAMMSTMGITLSFIGLYVMQEMNGNLYQPNKYVAAHILKKFDFVTMKTASTPIETNKALLKDKEAEDVDVHLYRSMIGSLMYLTAFRPDISLVVCACASDYAGASLDRKSTIEVVNFLAKDETIIKEWEDRIDRAAITASSLEVECQDTILGGAEAQTRFKVASKQSNDPPLLRVNTLGSGEDNMKPKELMEFTTVNAPTTTINEFTLAWTLIEIKVAKPKAVTSAATITTTIRPKARGVVVHEPSEFKTTSLPLQASQLPQAKDKGKAKMEKFDKEMKRVNTFVDMNTKLVKGSKTKAEGSSKRAGDELEQEKAKKQKGDDDQEEEEIKKHIEIVQDDEVAIDAIPLATKPLVIFEWNIIKEGKMGYFKLIRAYGSSKRYSSMISNTSR